MFDITYVRYYIFSILHSIDITYILYLYYTVTFSDKDTGEEEHFWIEETPKDDNGEGSNSFGPTNFVFLLFLGVNQTLTSPSLSEWELDSSLRPSGKAPSPSLFIFKFFCPSFFWSIKS